MRQSTKDVFTLRKVFHNLVRVGKLSIESFFQELKVRKFVWFFLVIINSLIDPSFNKQSTLKSSSE